MSRIKNEPQPAAYNGEASETQKNRLKRLAAILGVPVPSVRTSWEAQPEIAKLQRSVMALFHKANRHRKVKGLPALTYKIFIKRTLTRKGLEELIP